MIIGDWEFASNEFPVMITPFSWSIDNDEETDKFFLLFVCLFWYVHHCSHRFIGISRMLNEDANLLWNVSRELILRLLSVCTIMCHSVVVDKNLEEEPNNQVL